MRRLRSLWGAIEGPTATAWTLAALIGLAVLLSR